MLTYVFPGLELMFNNIFILFTSLQVLLNSVFYFIGLQVVFNYVFYFTGLQVVLNCMCFTLQVYK